VFYRPAPVLVIDHHSAQRLWKRIVGESRRGGKGFKSRRFANFFPTPLLLSSLAKFRQNSTKSVAEKGEAQTFFISWAGNRSRFFPIDGRRKTGSCHSDNSLSAWSYPTWSPHRLRCRGHEGGRVESADSLKAILSVADALVVRDGKDVNIDLINLSDRVPSDFRIVQVGDLAALEAALTGELVPIDKTGKTITTKANGLTLAVLSTAGKRDR
jgi:hypothetical protein